MQDHEIDAWLGDVELTDDQRAAFETEIDEIYVAYPDPDDQDVRDAAMSTAVQYLIGDATPAETGRALAHATGELARARAATRTMARLMAGGGTPESAISRELGVNRMTVRSALGK